MGVMTYYVALAFMKSDDGGEIVACDPKEARSAEQAIRIAGYWRRWRDIAEPSRFRGGATQLLATLTMR
jgi:hypothetical protein